MLQVLALCYTRPSPLPMLSRQRSPPLAQHCLNGHTARKLEKTPTEGPALCFQGTALSLRKSLSGTKRRRHQHRTGWCPGYPTAPGLELLCNKE